MCGERVGRLQLCFTLESEKSGITKCLFLSENQRFFFFLQKTKHMKGVKLEKYFPDGELFVDSVKLLRLRCPFKVLNGVRQAVLGKLL